MNIYSGKCLCEGFQYEITGELGPIFNCHCSKCRRWHGAAFRTRASINLEQYKVLRGEELLTSYKSSESVEKFFCRNCGSPLHSTYENKPGILGVPLGGIEGLNISPEAHIFVEHKASWHDINDDLPQYPNWPGSEENVRKTKN